MGWAIDLVGVKIDKNIGKQLVSQLILKYLKNERRFMIVIN